MKKIPEPGAEHGDSQPNVGQPTDAALNGPAAPTDTAAPTETAAPTVEVPAARPSFVRRHPLALGASAGVIAVVLISGLTAWGVDVALASSTRSGVAAAPAAPVAPVTPAAPKKNRDGRTLIRGTIATVGASSWAIITRAGKSSTVMIGAATLYGTKKAPGTAGDFVAGDAVVIVVKGGAAVRVTAAKPGAVHPGAPTPSATPSATPNS